MEICGDNRFEIIAKAKADLLEGTNIETDEAEMAVIDNILFRCWQMGWLDRYDRKTENSSEKANNSTISKMEQVEEPQTEPLEQFRVGLECHTDTTHFGKTKGESVTTNKIEDEPQTYITEDRTQMLDRWQTYHRNTTSVVTPCSNCQEFDCYGCEYKQTERSE